MKKSLFIFVLLFSHLISASPLTSEQENLLKECQVLLDQIAKSECGKQTLAFLQEAYIKVGLNMSQRGMTFEDKETGDEIFEMTGEWSPSPVLTLSLGDNYFEGSNFGYQLGFTYFSDTAFEQTIERSGQVEQVDLLTYSKMTVVSFSPSIFYSFGRSDDTPKSFFTTGLGLNTGYSKVKGTAHLTNNTGEAACDAATSALVNGMGSGDDIMANCPFGSYEEDGFALGASWNFTYEYHNWLTQISTSIYTIESSGDFTFSTSDVSISISRKFGF